MRLVGTFGCPRGGRTRFEYAKQKKQILHQINGYFPGGRLIAIMGPSGAGKSSLLNILTGFITSGVSGRVRINEADRDINGFKNISCYITQEDSLCGYLTVEENMLYAADFKIGPSQRKEEKIYKVNEVLISLGLFDKRDTMTSRLSGGEKKRLSVAQELLSDPMFLFLDEPTSGLDCSSCYQCIKELKALTRQGKTIICTIHQPSDGVFQLFDHLYLLAEGRCTYQGDVEKLVPFFKDLGLPCSIYSNPADYAIEMSSGDYGWDKVDQMVEAVDNGRNLIYTSVPEIKHKQDEHEFKCKMRLSPLQEVCTLIKWQWFKLYRKRSFTHLIIFGSITINMLIGVLNFNSANDASRMLHNYYMLLSFIIGNTQPVVMITILFFPTESSILRKELFNGYYRLKTYVLANMLTDYPLTLVCTIITTSIIYVMTGQIFDLKRYGMFVLAQIFVILISQSLGTLIGSAFTFLNAIFMGSFILIPIMLFSGFGFMLKDLALVGRFISHFAYLKYCLSMLSVALFGMGRPKWACPDDRYCLYLRGEHFMGEIGVDLNHYWTDVLFLCTAYTIIKFATYFVMKSRIKC